MNLKVIDSNIDNLIDTFGQYVKYIPGRLCSCVAENNGVPKLGCGCNLGFRYPEQGYDTVAIRTAVSYKYLSLPFGRVFDGGAQFTIPKIYSDTEQPAWKTLAHGDIIVVTNKFRRDTDTLIKGVRDYLYAFDISEIISVSQKDNIYTAGVDYTFEGNAINWVSANKPAENEAYTVEFTCKQQYKVWEVGAQDRGTFEDDLPKKVICVLRRYANTENVNPVDDFKFYSGNIYEGLGDA